MDVKERVRELTQRLTQEEWAGRAARGLPLYHVLAAEEFPIAFARKTLDQLVHAAQEWRRASSEIPGAAFVLGQVQAIAGDYAAADAAMAAYQKLAPADPMGAMRFAAPLASPQFDLPEVTGAWPKGPALFVACDAHYFRLFGVPLLRSFAAKGPGVPVHVHLMSGGPAALEPAPSLDLALTATFEDPEAFIAARGMKAPMYYHAVRLVRFAEALRRTDGPLCLMDADALANRDPRPLLDLPADLALRARAGRIEAVHHFSACLIAARAGARGYMDKVAAIVRATLANCWWGADQYALFKAFIEARPEIFFLGPEWADVEQSHDGVIWFTAADAKARLKTDETPYARLFRHYWAMRP